MQQFPTNPAYLAQLSQRLDATCSNVESARNVIILPTVRSFLATVIVESVVFRSSEWLSKYQIDCNDPTDLPNTIGASLDSTSNVLSTARITTYNGDNYILVAGVLERICKNWCGVFPFCR
jgi:hypothetical protein